MNLQKKVQKWTSSVLRPPGFGLTCGDTFVGGGVGGFASSSSSDCSIKLHNFKKNFL